MYWGWQWPTHTSPPLSCSTAAHLHLHPNPAPPRNTGTRPSLCHHPPNMNPMSAVHNTTTVQQSHVTPYPQSMQATLTSWGSVSVSLSPPWPFSSSAPHRQRWSHRLRCRARSPLCSSLPLFTFFVGFCAGLVKGFLGLGVMCFELVLLDLWLSMGFGWW